jgi:transcriptional regulator with XRE-family HTH domain
MVSRNVLPDAVEEGIHPMIQALPARRRLVGSVLRQYREAQGYKLEDAARILECDRSKISRIETGERGIRPKELRELLTEYGVDKDTQGTLVAIARPRNTGGWWQDYGKVFPDPYLDFIVAEGVASRIMVYAPLQVPELLCTAGYARAAAAADPGVPEGMEEGRVQATLAHRQAILFDRQPDLAVVIGEAALKQEAGGSQVMREQVGRLAELSSGYSWLNLRVLPFSAGAHAAGDGGAFSVLHFSETPALGLVHVSGASGGICLDDTAATAAYARTFSHLTWYTLTREQSQAKLRELAGR